MRNLMAGLASAALATMLGTAAYAEGPAKHKGLYVSGALGANWADDSDVSGGASGDVDFDVNWVGAVAVGYGFGNGVRVEGELSHRRSDADDFSGVSLSGKATATGLMANVLYDFDVSPRFVPYLGLGAGLAVVDADRLTPIPAGDFVDDDDTVFAWQVIAGVAVPLNERLDLTADYRYFDADNVDLTSAAGVSIDSEYSSHSVMIGLRYRFGAPKQAARPRPAAVVAPPLRPMPAPAPAPKPVAKPKPKPAPPPRSFIVFFDWDRANIRPDAQKVLEAAAAYAKRRGLVRVNLAGHADRSGPAKYNMRLSLRRAQAVKASFVKLGVSGRDISVVGRGESQPLVATADGVREPRNRRVEIAF
jgi:outer membrane protein OmpA-like peptidoglycan-associated protein